MQGLLSQFSVSLWLVLVVVAGTAVGASVVGFDRARSHRLWLPAVFRILTGGSILVIVAATAMPFADGFRFDGDLVLAPGGAGLGDLDQFLADPASLAGILLVSNIALYVPLAFFAVIGFHQRRHLVLVGCLILSLMVEATQFLLLGRVAATDDVILNMTGAALGLVAALALIGRSTRVRASLGMLESPVR